jgi:glutamate racemase
MTLGIFDSGLGGLLTAQYIKAYAPGVRILYYGDTAHLPYGDKSPQQVQAYAQEIVRFLLEAGAEGIVVACNTASAVAREVIRTEARDRPVWDAITATLQQFKAEPPAFPLGVIGTYTTIRSGIYGEAIRAYWPGAQVAELATPLLVPLIEEGFADHPATHLILETYLSAPMLGGIASLLLACTHYPLILHAIERYYAQRGQACHIYNSAQLLAQAVVTNLPAATSSVQGEDTFWVSDYTERFALLAARFWGRPILLQKAPAFVGV